MQSLPNRCPPSQPPLRAMIEIIDGELKIFPVCDTDVDERRILQALRLIRDESSEGGGMRMRPGVLE